MGQYLSQYMQSDMDLPNRKRLEEMLSKFKTEHIHVFETYEYEGVHLPLDSLKTTVDDLKTFEVRQDDVFIVTFPKAGTTWTQEIISAVLYDGDINRLNEIHVVMRVPYLELTHGAMVHENMPRTHKIISNFPRSTPRLIKSHLPGQLLPLQVWGKKIKMVYVIRDPKDVVVSLYHHYKAIYPNMSIGLDDVIDRFMKGTNPNGKWWDHCLYFWQRRNEDHLLVLRYEDIKKDLRGTVKRISEFLGKSFSDEILDAITDHCSFENMKKNPMTNPDTILQLLHGGEMPKGVTFMRKGQAGSWKAELSVSQSEALNALCREKLAGSGLTFDES